MSEIETGEAGWIKEKLRKTILDALGSLFPEKDLSELTVKVEYPPKAGMGDYACPVALEGARVFKQSPRETASQIKDILEGDKAHNKIIERFEIQGPGFLNIFLSEDFLSRNVLRISGEEYAYGRNVLSNNDFGPVCLEYVSANPTGPLNIVSARAASLGNSLYNLWKYTGIRVDSEYYINDFGNQVALLARSVALRYLEKQGEEINFPDDCYQGLYVHDIAETLAGSHRDVLAKQRYQLKDLEELADIFSDGALEFIISEQKEDLKNFGIVFDNWFSEKSLHDENKPEQAFRILEKTDFIIDENGKKIFESTKFGDDKDRVLIREDGRPAYFMADIAYHKDKFDRGYKKLFNIWGPDHHGYIARLKGALEVLDYPKGSLEVMIIQQVNLVKSGEVVKMSKRKGEFTTLRDLLEEIPRDVVRYFFIMRAADSPLDFDLELAKSESMDNPVYYIQYAHARISSVLRENEKNEAFKPNEPPAGFWEEPSRRILAQWLLRFPDEIAEIALNYEIHRLASYLNELASLFQKFYQVKANRVKGGDPGIAPGLLSLMIAVKNTIRRGLGILGIGAPESM